MSTKTHKYKYEHNKALIDDLDAKYNDWRITVIFYAALHLVETYLETTSLKAGKRNHFERKKLMNQVAFLKEIYGEYDFLYTQSIRSRYGFKEFSNNEVDKSKKSFENIESHILNP